MESKVRILSTNPIRALCFPFLQKETSIPGGAVGQGNTNLEAKHSVSFLTYCDPFLESKCSETCLLVWAIPPSQDCCSCEQIKSSISRCSHAIWSCPSSKCLGSLWHLRAGRKWRKQRCSWMLENRKYSPSRGPAIAFQGNSAGVEGIDLVLCKF